MLWKEKWKRDPTSFFFEASKIESKIEFLTFKLNIINSEE